MEDQQPPKLKDVVEELHSVTTKWKKIGRQLEVESATLKNIEAKYKNDPDEAFAEMIEAWLKLATKPEQTWSDILNVLCKQSVDERKLAKKLALNRGINLDDSGIDFQKEMQSI